MRKWKFIEQHLTTLKAPESLLSYCHIIDNIEQELNLTWNNEHDYLKMIEQNKFSIYEIISFAIFPTPDCYSYTNNKKYYLLKHHNCKNIIIQKHNNRCGEMKTSILSWLDSQMEKSKKVFCDYFNRPISINNYIIFSEGYYNYLKVGKVISLTKNNIIVSAISYSEKDPFNTTLSNKNNIFLIKENEIPDKFIKLLN